MRFIVRVDDVGQEYVQSEKDYDLALFAKWYECWKGLPLYCGIVTNCIGSNEMEWLKVNIPEQFRALHGYDHAKQYLTEDHIKKGLLLLPNANVVIPPYNLYNMATFRGMESMKKPTLLGGFREDHRFGERPYLVHGSILHISAQRVWYDKCNVLEHRIKAFDKEWGGRWEDLPHSWPAQVVLHHRWDAHDLDSVKRVRDLIADRMVPVDAAWEWLRK